MKFTPETNDPIAEGIIKCIDEAMQKHRNSQPPRKYLGASRIGEECDRKLAYEFHMTPKDEGSDFKGKTLRIFDMGHDGEERMAEYLKLAGFQLQTHTDEGKQIAIADANNQFKGHLDGYIHGGPENLGLKYPLLWENKALGDKSWNDLKKNGLKKSKPVYYAQVQVYMGYKELEACLFTALNRDTGEIYVEMVAFNSRDCQDYIDKVVRIIKTEVPEEAVKISKDPSDFRCKFCDFRQRCHSTISPTHQNKPTDITPPWLKRN
jgi:hypothetical protein